MFFPTIISWFVYFLNIIYILGIFLILLIPLLLFIAYLTLFERKILAGMQRRMGPNIVGFWGSLQPLADGCKLFAKELVIPFQANTNIFMFSPIFTLFSSFFSWAVIPFDLGVVLSDINLGVLFSLAISSFGVYGIVLAGWSSNSQYPFLGSLRSAAQMVSYEVSIGLIIMSVLCCVNSLNYTLIVLNQLHCWFIFPLFPIAILFFVSALAETSRPPFDLPEAEAELVSGYNVEYSGMSFAFFFLAEYLNMVLMSVLFVLFFLGGWLPFTNLTFLFSFLTFSFKFIFMLFCFVWVRAVLPRYRYDQLMRLGWKTFLPISFGFFLFVSVIIFVFNGIYIDVEFWFSPILNIYYYFKELQLNVVIYFVEILFME